MPELTSGGPIAELSTTGITLPIVGRTVRPSQMAGHPTYAPVVAHYARRKPGDVNAAHLEDVRTKAIAESELATRAIVIGVHIPDSIEDDPSLSEVLNRLRDKPVLYTAATGLGFKAHQIGFTEALQGGVIASFLA